MYDVRKYGRKIQNAVAGYSHIENLIRQATNTDTWGPTTEQKKQLLRYILTYSGSQNESYYNDIDLSGHIDPATTHEISQYVVNFIIDRIKEYSAHQHGSSIYEKLKRNFVVKGYEFLIIVKCLNLMEYLLLNCYRTDRGHTTYDIADDIKMHTSTFEDLKQYKVKICYDGLVLVHEKQVHNLAQRLLDLLSSDELISEERSKLRPTEKKIAAQGRLSTDSSVKAHRNPFGRSRVSSVSNSISSIITGKGHRHSQSSSRSVRFPEGQHSRYGTGYDEHDYNFNDHRIRQDEFPDASYASYGANDALTGAEDPETFNPTPVKNEIATDENAGTTQEENVWADEFGSLQIGGSKNKKPEEAQKVASSPVNLLSSLGIDDFGDFEVAQGGNSNIVHIPVQNTSNLGGTTQKESGNGKDGMRNAGESKKKNDMFGDLLMDFKTQS